MSDRIVEAFLVADEVLLGYAIEPGLLIIVDDPRMPPDVVAYSYSAYPEHGAIFVRDLCPEISPGTEQPVLEKP